MHFKIEKVVHFSISQIIVSNTESCSKSLLQLFVQCWFDSISHTWGEHGQREIACLQAKKKETYWGEKLIHF